MSDVINTNHRGELQVGTRACRRMRKAGFVPAVLYGHKEAVLNLIVKPGEVLSAVKAGHKLVDLKGDVNESALVKKVQWDALGSDIVHVDFERVSASELVETKVAIELKGEAAGVKAGGVLNFNTHEIEVECPAGSIPEKIVVSVKELEIDGEIFARDLTLPDGVRLISNEDEVIVSCNKPQAEEEEEGATPPGAIEPELIRKEKEGDEESD